MRERSRTLLAVMLGAGLCGATLWAAPAAWKTDQEAAREALRRGELELAEGLLLRAVQRISPPGQEHLGVLDDLFATGALRASRGHVQAAIRTLSRALVERRRVLPAGHPDLEANYALLGTLLLGAGRAEEAVGFLERSAEILMQRLPAEHPDLREALAQIERAYHRISFPGVTPPSPGSEPMVVELPRAPEKVAVEEEVPSPLSDAPALSAELPPPPEVSFEPEPEPEPVLEAEPRPEAFAAVVEQLASMPVVAKPAPVPRTSVLPSVAQQDEVPPPSPAFGETVRRMTRRIEVRRELRDLRSQVEELSIWFESSRGRVQYGSFEEASLRRFERETLERMDQLERLTIQVQQLRTEARTEDLGSVEEELGELTNQVRALIGPCARLSQELQQRVVEGLG